MLYLMFIWIWPDLDLGLRSQSFVDETKYHYLMFLARNMDWANWAVRESSLESHCQSHHFSTGLSGSQFCSPVSPSAIAIGSIDTHLHDAIGSRNVRSYNALVWPSTELHDA